MKAVNLLFVLVLLLSGAGGVAGAAPPDRAVGFVQLLTTLQPDVPIPVQARNAFQAVAPDLAAARRSGQILEFSPSFSTGVLRMVYRPSAGKLDIAGQPTYASIHDAVAVAHLPRPVARPIDSSSVQDALPGTFHLAVYDSCFWAEDLAPDARVIGSLRDTTGRIVSTYDGYADFTGYLDACFSWSGMSDQFIPGYNVTFMEYDSSVLLNTYTINVPRIKFTSINSAGSVVQGRGPAGKEFYAYWRHQRWNAGFDIYYGSVNGTVSGAGVWSADFGSIPIRGDDYLFVEVVQNAKFRFSREMWAPSTYCRMGGNYCEIWGFAFQPASLQIIHDALPYPFSGRFDYDGYFGAYLEGTEGDPIFMEAGDKVSGTAVAQYSLPAMTVDSIAYAGDLVRGTIPPGKYFWLNLMEPYGSNYGLYAHSNSSGDYAGDFTSMIDLKHGEPYVVRIYYTQESTGNETNFNRAFGP